MSAISGTVTIGPLVMTGYQSGARVDVSINGATCQFSLAKWEWLQFTEAASVSAAQRDRLAAELAECEKERDALKRHYDAAAPEHNLLALLDLFMEREHEAERQRDEYKRLHFDAIDERDRVRAVYDAAVAWRRPMCGAGGWGCDGCERCDAATETLVRAIDRAQEALK